MAQYNYHTILYTDTANVVGLDVTQNNSDLADYENNYQDDTVKISGVTVAETTFDIDYDYTTFKSKIASPLAWTDVKEVSTPNRYVLYVVTSEPL